MVRTRSAGVLAALAVVGCGGGSSKSGSDAGTGCAAYASQYCARLEACAPGILTVFGFGSASDCLASYQQSCEISLTAPHSGFTAAIAEQCGAAYAGQSCRDLLDGTQVLSACVIRGGTVADGGSCSSDWQCASGRCSNMQFGSCGSCVPQVPLRGACTMAECADGLTCSSTAGSSTQTCQMNVTLGAACAGGSVCPTDAVCAPTTQVCTKLPALGAPCDPGVDYFCDPTGPASFCDATTSTCVAASAVAEPGAACGGLGTTAPGPCNGACILSGDAGVGVCQSFIPPGGTCTPSDTCAFGLVCTAGVCAACGGDPPDAAAFPAIDLWAAPRAAALRARLPRSL